MTHLITLTTEEVGTLVDALWSQSELHWGCSQIREAEPQYRAHCMHQALKVDQLLDRIGVRHDRNYSSTFPCPK